MLFALYLTHKELHGEKVHFQTLKKKLRGLRRSSVVSNLAAVNNLFAHSKFIGQYSNDFPKIQEDLKYSYLRQSVRSKITENGLDNFVVFVRLQTLFLAQLSLLYSNDEVIELADGLTNAGFDLGDTCLIASDYLWSPREAANTGTGTDKKRIRHLGFQLAPGMELSNPLDMIAGIARSETIYSQILTSKEFRSILKDKRLDTFDITAEFQKATKISLQDYVDITVGLLSFMLTPDDKNLNVVRSFTVDGFLAQSNMKKETFKSYLKLEARDVEQFKSLFKSQGSYLNQHSFLPFKKFPLIELHKGIYICIDTFFLTEKLGAGIYWKLFDNLSDTKRETLSAVFGHLFELYVRTIFRAVTSHKSRDLKKGMLYSSPKYKGTDDESFDEIIYYPVSKHLIVIETKASLMHTTTKYGRSIKKFRGEMVKKFVKNKDGKDLGVTQLTKHIGRLFHSDKAKRFHLEDDELDYWIQNAEKISPVLVTQELVISFHINEDWLNDDFNKSLKQVRSSVGVSNLTVIDVQTLEELRPHLINGTPTFEQCINSRNYRDPEYKSHFADFVSDNFDLAHKTDEHTDSAIEAVFGRSKRLFFGEE